MNQSPGSHNQPPPPSPGEINPRPNNRVTRKPGRHPLAAKSSVKSPGGPAWKKRRSGNRPFDCSDSADSDGSMESKSRKATEVRARKMNPSLSHVMKSKSFSPHSSFDGKDLPLGAIISREDKNGELLVQRVCRLVEENRLDEMVKEVQEHMSEFQSSSPLHQLMQSDQIREEILELEQKKMALCNSIRRDRGTMMAMAANGLIPRGNDSSALKVRLNFDEGQARAGQLGLTQSKRLGNYKSLVPQIEAIRSLKCETAELRAMVVATVKSWDITVKEAELAMAAKMSQCLEREKKMASVLNENRQLYNKMQDLKGNIRIFCRVRPGNSAAMAAIEVDSAGRISVPNPQRNGQENKSYQFSNVFGMAATQEEVYADTQPLIRSVLDGYNVCIFAYGQTGSGKTHTMMGPNNPDPSQWGVNYRALHDLFQLSNERKSMTAYAITVQMVEIYNEQIRDLLDSISQGKKLDIRKTAVGKSCLPDATAVAVESTADVLDLMRRGSKNRAVGSTNMNERSSRSHSILTVKIEGREEATGARLHSSLHLIDLAGSERVGKSGATGARLDEAKSINKSLLALGNVMSGLQEKRGHVSFRDSKLTQMLEDSLGGQAKALMFVHVSPDAESLYETFSTLEFAERVSKVELGAAKANKEAPEVKILQDENQKLKEVLRKKDVEIEGLKLTQILAPPKEMMSRRSSSVAISSNATEPFSRRTSSISKPIAKNSSDPERAPMPMDIDPAPESKLSYNLRSRKKSISGSSTPAISRQSSASLNPPNIVPKDVEPTEQPLSPKSPKAVGAPQRSGSFVEQESPLTRNIAALRFQPWTGQVAVQDREETGGVVPMEMDRDKLESTFKELEQTFPVLQERNKVADAVQKLPKLKKSSGEVRKGSKASGSQKLIDSDGSQVTRSRIPKPPSGPLRRRNSVPNVPLTSGAAAAKEKLGLRSVRLSLGPGASGLPRLREDVEEDHGMEGK